MAIIKESSNKYYSIQMLKSDNEWHESFTWDYTELNKERVEQFISRMNNNTTPQNNNYRYNIVTSSYTEEIPE